MIPFERQIATPTDRDIVMTRVFQAPRQLVFDAWTKPELLRRWLGAQNGWTMETCEVDLRVGGRYRYVWHGPGREVMGMGGEYLAIVVPERLVTTEAFDEARYDGQATNTTDLAEADGLTTGTLTVRYDTLEIRDAVLAGCAVGGVASSYDRLAEILEELIVTVEEATSRRLR
jgi:uncharacterized protein YndB with AHSA1/START domain